jgi:hypothetical protein
LAWIWLVWSRQALYHWAILPALIGLV